MSEQATNDSQNKNKKLYNPQFMNEIYEYVNAQKQKQQNICLFGDVSMLDKFIKENFIQVYLPQQVEMTIKKKDEVQLVKPNADFLQQFVEQDSKYKLDKITTYHNTIKNNELKSDVSKFIIEELVYRMVLQYDKKEILDKEVKDFPTEELRPKDCGKCKNCEQQKPCKVSIKNKKVKEDYKCILTYKQALSHVSSEHNKLKKKYYDVLNTIIKCVNNLLMKSLIDNVDDKLNKKYYSAEIVEELQKAKKDQQEDVYKKVMKKISLSGSGKSFAQDIIEPEVHKILETLQTRSIDTKDKKQMFNINKISFDKFKLNYEKIINFTPDTTLQSYDITPMTTFINRQLKGSIIGCGVSIPATQTYIKEYLPHIISSCVSRFNYISNQKKGSQISDIFKFNIEIPEIVNNIDIQVKKVIKYIDIKSEDDTVEKPVVSKNIKKQKAEKTEKAEQTEAESADE